MVWEAGVKPAYPILRAGSEAAGSTPISFDILVGTLVFLLS